MGDFTVVTGLYTKPLDILTNNQQLGFHEKLAWSTCRQENITEFSTVTAVSGGNDTYMRTRRIMRSGMLNITEEKRASKRRG
jgi:hypothetical protein